LEVDEFIKFIKFVRFIKYKFEIRNSKFELVTFEFLHRRYILSSFFAGGESRLNGEF
jgi:hypothetical protein